MPKISGPAVYSCPCRGRSVEQGESCWCRQSQEAAMTRQEIRAAARWSRECPAEQELAGTFMERKNRRPWWKRHLQEAGYDNPATGERAWGCIGRSGEWSPETIPFNSDLGDYEWPMTRVGKKRAGRLLDGREWNEFPEVGR